MARWKKILLWTGGGFAVLLLAVLVAVPFIVPGIVKSQIREQVAANLDATAEVGSVSFSWPGSLSIRDLEIRDRDSKPVIRVGSVDVKVGVLSAVFGTYVADVKVDAPELLVRKLPDGRLNLETLVRVPPPPQAAPPQPAATSAPKPADPAPRAPAKLPAVRATIRVSGGRVLLNDAVTLSGLGASIDVPSLEQDSDFEFGAALGSGRLGAKGRIRAGSGPDSAAGKIAITVAGLGLDALQPAAALFARLDKLQGRLDVSLAYELAPGTKVSGGGTVKLVDFLAAGPDVGPEPATLPSLSFSHQVEIDPRGTGKQDFKLEAGDFATLTFAGSSRNLASTGDLDARLGGRIDLAGLSASLASLLQLKEGSRLAGRATLDGSLKASIAERSLKTASIDVSGRLADLAPTDATGRAIDLGADKDVLLELKADFDAATQVAKLHSAKLASGSIRVDASGGLVKDRVEDSTATIEADLDGLAAKLAQFMDLPATFGGRVNGRAQVRGTGESASATSTLKVSALRVTFPDGAGVGPLDLALEQSGRVDLRRGGRCVLDKFELRSSPFDVDATAEATDVADPKAVSGSATWKVVARPGVLTQTLAAFLGGTTLEGRDLESTGEATFRGPKVEAKGRLLVPDLRLAGDAVGRLDLGEAVASYVVAADSGTGALEIRDSTFNAGTLVSVRQGQKAELLHLLAKFGGTMEGDSLKGKAQVRLADAVITLEDLREEIAGVESDVAFSADLRTLDAAAETLVATVQKVVHGKGTGSATISGIRVDASGRKSGDDVELSKFEFASSLASGRGSATIRRLGLEGMSAGGRFEFSGDAAPLLQLAKVHVADLAGATATGRWTLVSTADSAGNSITANSELKITGLSVSGLKAGDKPVEMKDANVSLTSSSVIDTTGTGAAEIRDCRFEGPGASVTVSGRVGGFLGLKPVPTARLKLDATLQPDEITRRAAAFLLGYKLSGEPLRAGAELDVKGDVTTATGRLGAPRIEIAMPDGRVVAQRELGVDFDLTADLAPKAERFEIRSCSFSSSTAKGSISGTVSGLEKMVADVTGSAEADLETVMKDVGALFAPKDLVLKGRATATFSAKGSGKIATSLDATVTGFEQTMSGVTVADPKIRLVSRVDLETETEQLNLDVVSCEIQSGMANGTLKGRIDDATKAMQFRGLTGNFRYIPTKIGALLKSKLPGELKGDAEERIDFTLDGAASEIDPLVILRGLKGGANFGMGQFTMTGLAASGTMGLKFEGGVVHPEASLKVNGGTVTVRGGADLRTQSPVSSFEFGAGEVRLNGEMSPLLTALHPIFGALKGKTGSLDGFLASGVKFRYDGPLSMEVLTGGWEALPKRHLHGEGKVEFRDLAIHGSSFLAAVTDIFGRAIESKELRIRPIEFRIVAGRLSYLKPWQWTVAGSETTFTGTIGLDYDRPDCLDLVWRVPVTDEMVSRIPQLKWWRGETIDVPIRGTATSPRLMWKEVVAELVKKAVQKELEEKTKEGLEGLLGKDERKAKDLLKEADALWDQGRKPEAAAKYKKIKDDYDRTRAYKDNKDRIKERMNAK